MSMQFKAISARFNCMIAHLHGACSYTQEVR